MGYGDGIHLIYPNKTHKINGLYRHTIMATGASSSCKINLSRQLTIYFRADIFPCHEVDRKAAATPRMNSTAHAVGSEP
jgi:hypothetical protein